MLLCFQPTLGLGELAQKRLEASQRLQKDPMDLEAQQILAFVESQVYHMAQFHLGQNFRE